MGKSTALDPDELLSTRNPVLLAFIFYGGLCLLRTVLLSLLTLKTRFTKEVFASPEDVQAFCKDKEKKPILDDEQVERLRRNQAEDLESEVPFILIGMLFVLVNPHPLLACWLFRLFTASRLLHTVGYQMPDRLPQPYRTYVYTAGQVINVIMAAYVVVASFIVKPEK